MKQLLRNTAQTKFASEKEICFNGQKNYLIETLCREELVPMHKKVSQRSSSALPASYYTRAGGVVQKKVGQKMSRLYTLTLENKKPRPDFLVYLSSWLLLR